MRYKIFQTFSKEFQTTKLSFNHEPIDDFLICQWQNQKKSICWLIYRWCLALFFLIGTMLMITKNWLGGIWWIYFTDWGLVMCTTTTLFGAILVSLWFWKSSFLEERYTMIKCYWIFHWSTLVLAALITFVYWIFLFPYDTANGRNWSNLFAHASNSILMTVDHMLVAFPSRLFHTIFPITVAVFYLIFSLIYYFAGGLNIQGYRYIYPILDWSKPTIAIATVCGCAVFIIIFAFLMFTLYKFRCYLHKTKNSKNIYIL